LRTCVQPSLTRADNAAFQCLPFQALHNIRVFFVKLGNRSERFRLEAIEEDPLNAPLGSSKKTSWVGTCAALGRPFPATHAPAKVVCFCRKSDVYTSCLPDTESGKKPRRLSGETLPDQMYGTPQTPPRRLHAIYRGQNVETATGPVCI